MSTQPLHVELGVFERQRNSWLAEHANDYVVIKGESTLGFFDNFATAHEAGLNAFGSTEDFLVKRIVEREAAFFLY